MTDLTEMAGLAVLIFFTPFAILSALIAAAFMALEIVGIAIGVFSPDEVSRYE